MFVYRATLEFIIHLDVVRYGCGLVKGPYVPGFRIDQANKGLNVTEIPQGLNAPGCGAGPDGHEGF
jgi:hypothetical protein